MTREAWRIHRTIMMPLITAGLIMPMVNITTGRFKYIVRDLRR